MQVSPFFLHERVILTQKKASIHGLIILVLANSVNMYKELPETVTKQICDVIRSPKEGMLNKVLRSININQGSRSG